VTAPCGYRFESRSVSIVIGMKPGAYDGQALYVTVHTANVRPSANAIARQHHVHRHAIAGLDRVLPDAVPLHALQVTALDLPFDRSAIRIRHGQAIDDVRVLPFDGRHRAAERHEPADVEGVRDGVMREGGNGREQRHQSGRSKRPHDFPRRPV
jgi:hypothetical protein